MAGSTPRPAGARRRGRGSSAKLRAQWESVYESTPYEELPWFDPEPSPAVVDAVSRGFLRPGAAVLDVGCGAGSNVLFLARQGFEAHGVDLSPGAIRAAGSRAGRAGLAVDLRVGDALALDFPDRRFDGVVDIGCFHTVPIRRRPAYAQELGRVLRPGGAFVLSWVAREQTGDRGPPHRPSLEEVADALESRFLFVRTEFRPAGAVRGAAVYQAWMRRRDRPQPPRR
jgi:cyclopropane fatty-acyl-phospholipid synthase-like methyltransferase